MVLESLKNCVKYGVVEKALLKNIRGGEETVNTDGFPPGSTFEYNGVTYNISGDSYIIGDDGTVTFMEITTTDGDTIRVI